MKELRLVALSGIGEVQAGASLVELILHALERMQQTLAPGDVLVIAQKIVSKAEGRLVPLDGIVPSERAQAIAKAADKDARVMELLLRESREVLRVKPGIVIVEHRLGFVMANAGIDRSNVGPRGEECALLLPENPDASAARIRDAISARCGVTIGIIINDSFGRAWRNGVTGIAIGVAGLPALIDMRGKLDREGRELRVTEIAVADELAAAASLLMGQADEGTPVVLARGFPYALRESAIGELIRPRDQDLFR